MIVLCVAEAVVITGMACLLWGLFWDNKDTWMEVIKESKACKAERDAAVVERDKVSQEIQACRTEVSEYREEIKRYREYYELHSGKVRTALYRYWDIDGHLLYEGIASNPSHRLAQHRRSGAPWVAYAAQTTLEWFPDRQSAEAAERKAIQAERPIFNIVHNPDAERRRDEYIAARESSTP